MKILIADDDPTTLLILKKAAQQWGYDPIIAKNGNKAWEILTGENPPKIALLDWMMPHQSGVEICEKLLQRVDLPFVYTIIVTCKESRNERLQGLNSGAQDYLTKPIDPAELQSRLGIASRMVKMNQQLADDLEKIQKIEADLRISEQRLSAILTAVPDIIYRLDDKDRIVYVNEAIRDYGFSEEDLIGKNIFDLVHPCDRERAKFRVNERRTGKRRTVGFELNMLNKDNDAVPVELTASGVKMLPIFSLEAAGLYANPTDAESFVGTQGIARDVTLRRQAEAGLRAAQHRQRAIYQAAKSVGFVMTSLDSDCSVEDFSPGAEKIFAVSSDEILSKSFMNFVPDHSREIYCNYIDAIKQGRQPNSIELELVDSQGKKFPAACSIHPVEDNQGKTYLALSVISDLTQRVKIEKQKAKLESKIHETQKLESLGVLAGGIAHDFNNILVSIMGNVDLAMMDVSSSTPILRELKDIKKAAKRAADLTEQMLAYSGKGRFVVQPENINLLVSDVRDIIRASLSKKVTLQYDLDQSLDAIQCDATQIRQILMNLILNSSEAIDKEIGLISVITKNITLTSDQTSKYITDEKIKPGNYALLEVRDSGSGIDPKIMSQIFEPFFTTKFTGRGLGLSAVLGIVKGHKGGISVESKSGVGTTVSIIFPATKNRPVEHYESAETSKFHDSGKVLVIDDEPNVRKIADFMLRKIGFETKLAEDGYTGLELLSEDVNDYKLVLLDVSMPGISGIEVLKKIRQINSEIPVLLYSGFTNTELETEIAADEKTKFLAKPFEFNQLAEAIKLILEE